MRHIIGQRNVVLDGEIPCEDPTTMCTVVLIASVPEIAIGCFKRVHDVRVQLFLNCELSPSIAGFADEGPRQPVVVIDCESAGRGSPGSDELSTRVHGVSVNSCMS